MSFINTRSSMSNLKEMISKENKLDLDLLSEDNDSIIFDALHCEIKFEVNSGQTNYSWLRCYQDALPRSPCVLWWWLVLKHFVRVSTKEIRFAILDDTSSLISTNSPYCERSEAASNKWIWAFLSAELSLEHIDNFLAESTINQCLLAKLWVQRVNMFPHILIGLFTTHTLINRWLQAVVVKNVLLQRWSEAWLFVFRENSKSRAEVSWSIIIDWQ